MAVVIKDNPKDFNNWVDSTKHIYGVLHKLADASGGFEHYLGEEFEGGIIYHLYKGSDGVEHGLIVNKAESAEIWQTVESETNADRTDDGLYNTGLMINSPAATYVNNLSDGGFTDWYLPSIDEFNLLYNNRFFVQKTLRTLDEAPLSMILNYWSSTEWIGNTSFVMHFQMRYGRSNYNGKASADVVRAIRSF
jgi:hypothetical protein